MATDLKEVWPYKRGAILRTSFSELVGALAAAGQLPPGSEYVECRTVLGGEHLEIKLHSRELAVFGEAGEYPAIRLGDWEHCRRG